MTPETVAGLAAMAAAGGTGIGVAIKYAGTIFANEKNGHTKLTVSEHERICAPVKQRLSDGETHFENIEAKLDMVLNALINKK